ncbi:MAG: CDP-paratose 2-epimerase [Candidatus Tectimicrobiota bacterium]
MLPYPLVVQQLLQGLEPTPTVPDARLAPYRLERFQLLPRPIDEVFAFFAEPQNLEAITPPFLRFRILTAAPIHLTPGSLIEYRLQLFHMPFHWRTRIELYHPPCCFTDVQLAGPYRYWHHLHVFCTVPGGTLALDRVDYALPWGLLGQAVHTLSVRRLLERIFDYRRQQLQAFFPPLPA